MIEGIMDFVFNNLFIVIIVIVIVSNLISSSKKTQRRNEQADSDRSSSSGETQTSQTDTLESKIERNLKKFENIFEQEEVPEKPITKSQPVEKAMTSIEIRRKKQKDELANRFQTRTKTPKLDIAKQETKGSATVIKHHRLKSSVTQKSLKKRVSMKGLQESIIMAEVLGKPRSLNPYRSKLDQK